MTNYRNKFSLVFLFIVGISAITGTAHAIGPEMRSCTIAENFTSGGYTYTRCREQRGDLWLAMAQTPVSIGETILFQDSPPMLNFTSKSLNRTFPKIIFVLEITRSGAPTASGDSVYTGTDDEGTLVFTDDPSRAPKSVRRAVKKVR